jgi:hypothetical protein
MDIRCICPPKHDGTPRHDHDTVTLRERMDFRSSIAIRNALGLEAGPDGSLDMADLLAILTERFVLYGIQAWSVVDEKNQPVPVSRQAVTDLILSDIELATAIGDAADDLYRNAVMLPLLQGGQTSSPSTSTNGSTSARKASSTKRRTRSSPSSITAIPTAVTETTSNAPDGDSSSSQRSA